MRHNPPLKSVRQLGPNMTEVEHGDITVLYSYRTPVVIHARLEGAVQFFVTDTHYSNTTSRHISKYLRDEWGLSDENIKAIKKKATLPQHWINRSVEEGRLLTGTPRHNPTAISPGRVGPGTIPSAISGQVPGRWAPGKVDMGPRAGPRFGVPGRTPHANPGGGDAIDDYLWSLSLESWEDAQTGSVDECGWWAGMFRHGHTLSGGPGWDELTEDEQEAIADAAGAIVWVDSQGFIDSRLYDTQEELDEAWGAWMADDEECHQEE